MGVRPQQFNNYTLAYEKESRATFLSLILFPHNALPDNPQENLTFSEGREHIEYIYIYRQVCTVNIPCP